MNETFVFYEKKRKNSFNLRRNKISEQVKDFQSEETKKYHVVINDLIENFGVYFLCYGKA